MQPVQTQMQQLLRVWEKIELLAGEDDAPGCYRARIEDFISDGIVISSPVYMRGNTLLRDGMSVIVRFTREDASYQFQSRINRLDNKETAQMLLTPPQRIQRMQRRHFVRIDNRDTLTYALLVPDADSVNWDDRDRWIPSQCHNISGGGALIEVRERIAEGGVLLLRLDFFRKHRLPGTVAAVCRRPGMKKKKHLAGVEFIISEHLHEYFDEITRWHLPPSVNDFSPRMQNKLVMTIFNEQINMRRKGLL